MHLVRGVQHGGFRIAPHACRAHFVNPEPNADLPVAGAYVLEAGGFEHLRGIVHHVLTHFAFVFLELHIEREHRQTPLVLARSIDRHAILVVREHLAEAADADVPRPRRRGLRLEVRADDVPLDE